MNKIIGLCGTHGTGKSTIINGIHQRGIACNSAELSRTAQKQLGWESLSLVKESEQNMWSLQDAIIQAMYERDTTINNSGVVTIVERTPADVWAYTALWLKHFNISTDSLRAKTYKNKCMSMSALYRGFIVVPINQEIKFVSESARASLEHLDFVANEIDRFLITGKLKHHTIQNTSPSDRIDEVEWATLLYFNNIEEESNV